MHCNLSKSPARSRGAALLEFALVVGILVLPLVAAIFSLGRFLWQIQFVTDSARYGVRSAHTASFSNTSLTCNDLIMKARMGANYNRSLIDYEWALEGRHPTDLWNDAVGRVRPVYKFKSVPMRVIEVKIPPKEQDNCLFCYQDLLRRILPNVYARFDISKNSVCTQESQYDYLCLGGSCSQAAMELLGR